MLYGAKGISEDCKFAVSKVVVDEDNTSAIEELVSLGFQFVDKEEYESIVCYPQFDFGTSESGHNGSFWDELDAAYREGVDSV